MRKTSKILLGSFLVAALPAAWAGEVNITKPADPDGVVGIEIIAGTVDIVAWERDQVEITGTIDEDRLELDVYTDDGEIWIEVEPRDHRGMDWDDISAELTIRVPGGSSIEAETISADLNIDGVAGEVSVESVSGDLTVEGDLRAIAVESVSGRVRIDNRGDLEDGSFESVSGTVELSTGLTGDGRLTIEVVNGNIELRVPSGTSAEFDVSTFSGDIDNELGPPAKRTSDYLPSKEVSFTLGSGGARVSIECFNGRIKLGWR
jgi:DUF4097 and DUF4098 domain-containing protein YvlB